MPKRSPQSTSSADTRLAELSGQVTHHMDIALVWVSTVSGRFELANRTGLALLGVGALAELATIPIPPVGVTVRDQRLGWATREDLLYTAALVIADPVVPSAEHLPHMITVIDAPLDEVGGFAIVGLSVDELHSSFRAMEASQALLWSFLDNMPAEIFMIDLDGRFTMVNQHLVESAGVPRAELLGHSLVELYGRDLAGLIERNDAEVLRSGRPMEFDEVFGTTKGRRLFRSFKFPVIRDGQITAMGGVAMDVTDRAHAEAARELSEAQFRLAFEQANDGMAIIDLDGTYVQVNQRLCDMLQRSEAEIVGQHVEAFFQHDNTASFEANKRIVESEGRATFDNVLCRGDGAAIYVRVSSALLTTDAGEPLHLIASYSDETERREREARARQREKLEALGQFAGGVAHDINNLLSGVLGYSELVMAEVTDPTTRGYCEQLISATMRAVDFTSRLLAFTGEGSTTSVAFDVNTIVTEVADMLRQRVTGEIEVVVNAAAGEMAVIGDPSQIHGALLNLGLNARDAIVDGPGTITFTATSRETAAGDTSVRVAVRDTGIGIEPVALAKLFEPFYTTKASGLGTGLGLPSVAAAAQQHGGDVTVESVVGMGSTFTIELPIGDVGADSSNRPER